MVIIFGNVSLVYGFLFLCFYKNEGLNCRLVLCVRILEELKLLLGD